MRLRFFTALLIVALFLNATTPRALSASIHGCASPNPPPVPGSPATAPAIPGWLLINEVLLTPASTWNCSEPNGTFTPGRNAWVELYNPQSQPLRGTCQFRYRPEHTCILSSIRCGYCSAWLSCAFSFSKHRYSRHPCKFTPGYCWSYN